MVERDLILEALARGYCTKENENKQLDPDLCGAMADEVLKVLPSETLDRMPTDAVIAAICKWMTWDYGDKAMRAEASELYHVIQNAAPQDAVSASAALPGHARTVAPNPAVAAPHSQQFDKDYLSLVETLRDPVSVGRCTPLDMAANAIEELLRERAARTLELAALRKVNVALSAPSATLPHDLIYKLHGWTRQIAEQPPHRVSPGIANAAQRLHEELQLYVNCKGPK